MHPFELLIEETPLTANQIIDETVEYYRHNPRSVEKVYLPDENFTTKCLYKSPNGAMCALGRCFTNEGLQLVLDKGYNAGHGASMIERYIGLDNQLQPKYKGQTNLFWRNLQDLHDNDDYWKADEIGNELTKYGLEVLNIIKRKD